MPTRNNPVTSLQADKAMTKQLRDKDYLKILKALKSLKKGIYTDISAKGKMEPVKVGRRLSEMEREQWVYKDGTQKITPSGRKAFVYFISAIGLMKADESQDEQSVLTLNNKGMYIEQKLF